MKKIKLNNNDTISITITRDPIVVEPGHLEEYKEGKELEKFLSNIKLSGEIVIAKQSGDFVIRSVDMWRAGESETS